MSAAGSHGVDIRAAWKNDQPRGAGCHTHISSILTYARQMVVEIAHRVREAPEGMSRWTAADDWPIHTRAALAP